MSSDRNDEGTDKSWSIVDEPIKKDSEDRLGRTSLADAIAMDLMNATGSMVVAVTGPWGGGKTSVLELVRARLEAQEVVVVDFNPWFFAGTDQLIHRFFTELVAQISSRKDKRLNSLIGSLERYGRALGYIEDLPGVGGAAKAGQIGIRVTEQVLRHKDRFAENSVDKQRQKIKAALSKSDVRLVVLVDDIDRLEQEEIRDIVRLVRLVADFPCVNYLLAFDRSRVEVALGRGDSKLGRDYLEKIVQMSYVLPLPEQSALRDFTRARLETTLDQRELLPFDSSYLSVLWHRVIAPMIRTPRDVIRYTNAVKGALKSLSEEVNPADIMALEACRIFVPDVFDELPRLAAALTTTSGMAGMANSYAERKAGFQKSVNEVILKSGEHTEAIVAFFEEVFPATTQWASNLIINGDRKGTWRKARRVASSEVLAFYFTHALSPNTLPTTTVMAAFQSLSDAKAIETILKGTNDEDLESLLERLEDYEGEFPDDPTGALVAMENLRSRVPRTLPDINRMFNGRPDTDSRIDRIVPRLLQKVKSESDREEILKHVLPRLTTLSAQMWLVFQAGHHEGIGLRLISTDAQKLFDDGLRDAIRNAPVSSLGQERDLYHLLAFLAEQDNPLTRQTIDRVAEDDRALGGLLESSITVVSSQDQTGLTKNKPRFPWASLEALIGADVLKARVEQLTLSDQNDHDWEITLNLAKRYAGGWRPKEFGGDEDD